MAAVSYTHLNEADAKAREVIRQALTEKQAELEEIDRLKASREEFKACLLYTSRCV